MRRRRRTYREVDQATARGFAEADGTVVEVAMELPGAPATCEILNHAGELRIQLSPAPGRDEVVVKILQAFMERCHVAEVTCGTTIPDEPYALMGSRQGIRLRCFLLEASEPADIVGEDKLPGWHLYRIDQMESVQDTGQTFKPPLYRELHDEIVVRITA